MAPFLRTMSVISKFTVESQVQHYASLTFQPDLDATAKEYYLTPDKLPNFINTAEWSLGKKCLFEKKIASPFLSFESKL